MISCHSLFTSWYSVKKGFLFSSIYISMNADSYSIHWVIIHYRYFDVRIMPHLPKGASLSQFSCPSDMSHPSWTTTLLSCTVRRLLPKPRLPYSGALDSSHNYTVILLAFCPFTELNTRNFLFHKYP